MKQKKQKINTTFLVKKTRMNSPHFVFLSWLVPRFPPYRSPLLTHTPTQTYQVWEGNTAIIYTCFYKICKRPREMKTNVRNKRIYTCKSCKIHVNNTCIIFPLHCHVRCCCSPALCGHCAGQSAAQSLCGPLCIITAVSVPAGGKFVCNSPELEALTQLSPWYGLMVCLLLRFCF